MNCPYCGKEMKKGKFELNKYIYWDPDDREPGLFRWVMDTRSIQVPHEGHWESANRVPNIKAYHCPACRKFIFDGKLNE